MNAHTVKSIDQEKLSNCRIYSLMNDNYTLPPEEGGITILSTTPFTLITTVLFSPNPLIDSNPFNGHNSRRAVLHGKLRRCPIHGRPSAGDLIFFTFKRTKAWGFLEE